MKISKIVLLLIFTIFFEHDTNAQDEIWRKFVALESDRTEIEKELGNPKTQHDSFGIYENADGKYFVWYSVGECSKNAAELSYRVRSGVMTALSYRPKKTVPIETYAKEISSFKQVPSPMSSRRTLFIAPDNSLIFETLNYPNGSQVVNAISITPSSDKRGLLCTNP